MGQYCEKPYRSVLCACVVKKKKKLWACFTDIFTHILLFVCEYVGKIRLGNTNRRGDHGCSLLAPDFFSWL